MTKVSKTAAFLIGGVVHIAACYVAMGALACARWFLRWTLLMRGK